MDISPRFTPYEFIMNLRNPDNRLFGGDTPLGYNGSGLSHMESAMRSHEVLRKAADAIGVKALAAKLRLSTALVYKWCEEAEPHDPDSSGALNPLDRVAEVFRATQDPDVVNWICHEAGGFFVPNPTEAPNDHRTELLVDTQRLVREFSQLLLAVTRSIEDDGVIHAPEAERIRAAWELLKRTVEEFTVTCERGLYSNLRGKPDGGQPTRD